MGCKTDMYAGVCKMLWLGGVGLTTLYLLHVLLPLVLHATASRGLVDGCKACDAVI